MAPGHMVSHMVSMVSMVSIYYPRAFHISKSFFRITNLCKNVYSRLLIMRCRACFSANAV